MRLNTTIHTFPDWNDFVNYTLDGHRIDVKYAKENEFLAPLLQNLTKGPGVVDPIGVRREFMLMKLRRKGECTKPPPVVALQSSSLAPVASLSPAASDFSPSSSRSVTPDPFYSIEDSSNADDPWADFDFENGQSSQSMSPVSTPSKVMPSLDHTRRPEPIASRFEQKPPQLSQMQERHRNPPSSLRKRPRDSTPPAECPCKRLKTPKTGVSICKWLHSSKKM